MPFELPKSLAEWLERRSPKAKIEQLFNTIDEVNALIQARDGTLSTVTQRHIFMAEEEYKSALAIYKDDDQECLRFCQRGLFRLELAKQQLAIDREVECQPNFEPDSAEFICLKLSGSIIKIKMAIEFSNCIVSEVNCQRLMAVVEMFNSAAELLRDQRRQIAKRTAEGGLLMLYSLNREIEIDNKESIVELKQIAKIVAREAEPIFEALVAIYNVKENGGDCREPDSARFQMLLHDAMENINSALDALINNDCAQIDKLSETAILQAHQAKNLLNSSSDHDQKSPLTPATKPEDAHEKRIRIFKTEMVMLQRLVSNRAPQGELAQRRLDEALQYYLRAANTYVKALAEADAKDRAKLLIEAESLARAGRIDLDFGRNLLFTSEKVPYKEMIKWIARNDDNH